MESRRTTTRCSLLGSTERVALGGSLAQLLAAALLLAAIGCSDNNSSNSDNTGSTDAIREIFPERDLSTDDQPDSTDLSGDQTQSDLGISADSQSSSDTSIDSDGGSTEPSPDNLLIGCLTNADCPASGDDPGVCCTEALRYESFCSTESACEGGRRDACLTDAQCAQRRPGEWSVCCHDRYDRNYCAPLLGTCQTLSPCGQPSDCSGNSTEPCCSYHAFYQTSFCTNEFFANNPDVDCP